MILPVGHYLGQYYSSATLEPDSFDVRVGDDVHNLSADEYTVWSIAHGFPEMIGDRRPSRPIVEAQATQLGIEDSPVVFQRLVNSGLVAALTMRSQMFDFAEEHRAYPSAVCLGNTAQDVESYVLGRAQTPLATVTQDVFFVWSYLPRFESLRDAADEVAADYAANGSEQDSENFSSDVILWSFFQALPTLVATSCVFIDQV